MKLGTLICALALSASMAAGVGVAVATSASYNLVEVNAAGTLSGGQNLFLKVDNSNWTSDGAAFAVYVYNSDTDNSWAWFDSATALSGDYRAATIPTGTWSKLIVCRMNPNGSDSSNNYLNWNNKWNQTGDITTISGDVITISGSNWDGAAYSWDTLSNIYNYKIYHSNETDGTWSTTSQISLSYKNDSDGAQYYNTSVSLTTGMKFDIVRNGSSWFHSEYLEDGGAVGTYLEKNGTTDASVTEGGTFEFYVKVKNNTVWTQVSSVTEAETWSKGFVQGVGCSTSLSTGNPPANWSTYSGTYASLTNGAKNIMYGMTGSNAEGATYSEQAAFIYDLCVKKYTSCANDKFMVNSGGTPRSANINTLSMLSNESSIVPVITLIAGLIGISTIGIFVFLRKRKQDN